MAPEKENVKYTERIKTDQEGCFKNISAVMDNN